MSIADLGGAEVDLRFTNKDEGDVSVVVAPVARFADIGAHGPPRARTCPRRARRAALMRC